MSRALRVTLILSSLLFAPLAVGGCGGAGEVGEECSTPGETSQCVDGAVCHDRSSGDAPGRCRIICTDDRDCPGGGSCEDVSESSFKGCV